MALELTMPGHAPDGALEVAHRAWQQLQQELDSRSVSAARRCRADRSSTAWLEAAAFYDKLDRDRAYDQLIDQWGKAAEGLGSQLMEEAARVVLLLDEAAAAALGEPVILPPPREDTAAAAGSEGSVVERLLGR